MSHVLRQIASLRKNLAELSEDNATETIQLLDALAAFAATHDLAVEPLVKMRQAAEQFQLARLFGWTRSQSAKALHRVAESETKLLLSKLETRAKRTDVQAGTKGKRRWPSG